MSTFEQLFNNCVLQVTIPNTSVSFPEPGPADDWLNGLGAQHIERRQAFFDEQLYVYLTVKVDHPPSDPPPEPSRVPKLLLDFFAHIQVSLEATYISPSSASHTDSLSPARLSAPPRSTSIQSKARLTVPHPSIFPPSTPNPIPSTAENDRKYVQAEGTLLIAKIWGQDASNDSHEKFTIVFSEADGAWVAVYRLSLVVSFLRLNILDPLLCLTISATLREKALSMTQSKHPFVAFLTSMESKSSTDDLLPSLPGRINDATADGEHDLEGLEEVNLLEGLSNAPSFSSTTNPEITPAAKYFPSPPVVSSSPQTSSPTKAQTSTHPTLRKSFRKTMHTVSGFRVRMRTVFVPYVLLPETRNHDLDSSTSTSDDSDSSDSGSVDDREDERDQREAGNDEHTVVLCVEIENSGDAGPEVGFSVESIDVNIGGEGATATLIGWGEGVFGKEAEKHVFPLPIGSMEQYNLLYAVSFLHPPGDMDTFSLPGHGKDARSGTKWSTELQRAVTININGKPFAKGEALSEEDDGTATVSYPTRTFSSRWNCVLDLSTRPREEASDSWYGNHNALPEPPSPFPTHPIVTPAQFPPHTARDTHHPQDLVAGSKRHTLPGSITALRAINPPLSSASTSLRSSTLLNPSIREQSVSPHPGRGSFTPPSVAVKAYARSPTSYGALPSIGSVGSLAGSAVDPNGAGAVEQFAAPPPTPAYPAYPATAAVPPTPYSQASMSNQQGALGPSVEIRRERGTGMGVSSPHTPGPTVIGASFADRLQEVNANVPAEVSSQPIIVSVGLLPRESTRRSKTPQNSDRIYPYEEFTLDIFVFNRSSWTRRFEVSYPDAALRRRRKTERKGEGGAASLEELKNATSPPGILPLQNRVRIGPLRPSTCQSVRMDFMAMKPGVHSVEVLTLTDIESGFAMNLRSVMDIVVHEPHVSVS
ncbi:hypothetical protein SERLA73DRAFT_168196 [Serpula lacrymans var. lacrymans S7.3]|uniref:Trafficking protein particle complex II-specific subunit 65 IgD3 domain-containing protein n=1 Tax=Serpula lacrymans var. lacrymans (strain S7.3) TaxID=936435 RepID=F8PUQ3_SERL3|nr:hypothetical protein SERLA73DRAFT_168196 [Serpula lacrymans var. lacrymans S7.3]